MIIKGVLKYILRIRVGINYGLSWEIAAFQERCIGESTAEKEWEYSQEKSHRNLTMFFAALRANFSLWQFHGVNGCIEDFTHKDSVKNAYGF